MNVGNSWKDKTRLTDLHAADDIALIAETKEYLQSITTNVESDAGKVGQRINDDKTSSWRVVTLLRARA